MNRCRSRVLAELAFAAGLISNCVQLQAGAHAVAPLAATSVKTTAASVPKPSALSAVAPEYSVEAIEIPSIPVSSIAGLQPVQEIEAEPKSINDKGHIIYTCYVVETYKKALFDSDISLQHPLSFFWDGIESIAIPSLGGNSVVAEGLNNHDVVVGWSSIDNKNQEQHAFKFSNGVVTDLQTSVQFFALSTDTTVVSTHANGISDYGTVVGDFEFVSPEDSLGAREHACEWTSRFGCIDIGLTNQMPTTATAINKDGEIVGNDQASQHSVRFQSGSVDLNVPDDWAYSRAISINGKGHVLCRGSDATGSFHTVLSGRSLYAHIEELDRGLGSANKLPYGFNDHDDIVGTCFSAQQTPVLCRNGIMYDLDSCVPPDQTRKLLAAYAINNSGQIVCSGLSHGRSAIFLLTPIVAYSTK